MGKNYQEQMRDDSHKEELEFEKLIPKSGFLAAYMKYTRRQESPSSYHFWVGATVLGAALQRRVWVSKGLYNIYPNLFTLLVAPTGKVRKTSAAKIGVNILRDFDWINTMADKTTPEALLEALMVGTKNVGQDKAETLAGDSTGFIVSYELSNFLSRQNYNSGMAELLTDLYDCPETFKYVTRGRKGVVLKNVALQFLGCSTQDWLATSLPENVFGGGFMSRFIFMVKDHRDRSIPLPVEPDSEERVELIRMILAIRAQVSGKVELSKAAVDYFVDWYHALEREPVYDQNLVGFVERKPDTVLKVALILAASVGDTEISEETLHDAYRIVTWTQERMFKAFTHIDMTPRGALTTKIRDFIDSKDGVATRRDVLAKFSSRFPSGLKDLLEIENLMVESGNIELEHVSNAHGRPTVRYVLKERK